MKRAILVVGLAALAACLCVDRPAWGEEAKARLLGRVQNVDVEKNLFTVVILEGQIKGAGEEARKAGDEITFGVNKETEIRGVAGLGGLTAGRRAWITYEPREIPGARHLATLIDVLMIREGDEPKE